MPTASWMTPAPLTPSSCLPCHAGLPALWVLVLTLAVLFSAVEPRAIFAAPAPPTPGTLWVTAAGEGGAAIAWRPVRGATVYEVYRGGRLVARTRSTSFMERALPSAAYLAYQVSAVRGGSASPRSDLLPLTTLAPRTCTHVVSSDGDDAGDGSSARPWRTIGRLVDAWKPGWVGCLRGRFAEDVTIRRGGSADAKVILRGEPGAGGVVRGRIWIVDGANHVVVSDLSLDGRALRGAGAGDLPSPTVNGDGAMFLRNDIHNARTRVCFVIGSVRGYGRADGTVLASNRIRDCGARRADGTTENTHHGIYVEHARRTAIVQNVIFRNADRGIQLYPDAVRTLVARNVIDRNGEGIIFSGGDGLASSSNRVVRNVVTNSRLRSDIEHYWEPGSPVGRDNLVLRNCVGGGADGAFARPIVGYSARGNVTGAPPYRDPARGDFRLRSGGGSTSCRDWMRSIVLPLAPR